jgi:uncharacterized membrane protein YqjE
MSEQQDPTFGSLARELRADIAAYVDARVEYTKLVAYEKVARLSASATTVLLLGALAFFTFLFLSITLALFLGEIIHNQVAGYAIVTGIDLLAVLIILWRKVKIEESITQRIVDQLLKEHDKEEEEQLQKDETTR